LRQTGQIAGKSRLEGAGRGKKERRGVKRQVMGGGTAQPALSRTRKGVGKERKGGGTAQQGTGREGKAPANG